MTEKKRLCLFAGFDKKGEIADYVIYYLKALSQVADVYYWGDFKASSSEKAKIKPYCKEVYCAKHGKYDFGSWQELIEKIGREKIETYDELVFANDSCYGPLFELKDLFSNMDERECDFWGLSSAYRSHIHLQSYFLVLKQSVIRSNVFYNFFKQVKPETDYCSVCANYEDQFTYLLSKSGFRYESYIKYGDMSHHPYCDIMAAIKYKHFPFLKVKFFLGGIRDQAGVQNWRQIIKNYTKYPVKLIENDLQRRGFDLAEIDRAVQEKQSETPNFYSHGPLLRRVAKKTGKFLLRPALNLINTYIDRRTSQYYYKVDRMNRSYRELQRKYNELQIQIDPDFESKKIHLVDNQMTCDLKLTDRDASFIKRFDLEFSLMDTANVLIIGNITIHNLASLELYNPQVICLNNDWADGLKVDGASTKDLCNFKFADENGQQIYFDLILVQPLETDAPDDKIKQFVTNLKHQMILESALVMMVANKETERYTQILQSAGLCPANSERGLVVSYDPFQIYYDKIDSIKGYSVLIYKIK